MLVASCWLTATLVVCCLAQTARAVVRPLAPVPSDEPSLFALAGERAIVARGGLGSPELGVLRVRALPVAGGPGIELARLSPSHDNEYIVPEARSLDASASAIGMIVSYLGELPPFISQQAFGGAPTGPLTALGPSVETERGLPYPDEVRVEGDRLVIVRRDDVIAPTTVRLTVRDPGAAAVTVALPRTATNVVLAGELVAFASHRSRHGEPGTQLQIREWRSGRTRRRIAIPAGVRHVDLLGDGRALVDTDSDRILEVAADGSIRSVSRHGIASVYAGDSIVFTSGERLLVAGPDRRPRRLGYPSATIGQIAADDRRVLWQANGCLVTAELDATALGAAPAGPCPRSEVALPGGDLRSRLRRDGRMAVLARCVTAAAPEGCRGTVRLRQLRGMAAPGETVGVARLRIPAGRRRTIAVRLTRFGASLLRTASDGVDVDLRITATDRAGRSSSVNSVLSIRRDGG